MCGTAGFTCMVNLHRASTPSEQSREVLTDAVELYVLDHIDYHLIRIRELLHAHIYIGV